MMQVYHSSVIPTKVGSQTHQHEVKNLAELQQLLGPDFRRDDIQKKDGAVSC